MKEFCRYAVIDIRTGNLLIDGQKWKDFNSGNIRFIKAGVCKTFPIFGRTLTVYFRTVEINGCSCAIVYWAQRRGKRLYNVVTLSGAGLYLRGRDYNLTPRGYGEVYRKLLNQLGVTYENI